MNKIFRNGIVLPVALGTLLATSLGAVASPARDNPRQDQRQERKDQREDRKEQRAEQRADRREQRHELRQDQRQAVHLDRRQEVRQDRREDRRDARQDHRQERHEDRREQRQDNRQDRREVRQEIRHDRREVRRDIRQDRHDVRRDIRQDRRAHQRYRDDYYRRMRTLQSRHYSPRWYHGGNYRYLRGGQWYRVNYYAADMLRNAIDQGYREGLRAGRADRYDGWRGGYRTSTVWVDASFGYMGSYVSRSEYNYYFRQGFERGYEDGMYGRNRYGRYVNGEAIIIDAVLSSILNLQRY